MKLSLGFKGQRNYIQGGDIFNALTEVAPKITGDASAYVASLAFRTFARRGCSVSLEQPVSEARLIAQAELACADQTKTVMAWITENTDPVTDRRPFDEEALLSPSVTDVEAMTCTLPLRSVYTPIEDLIAMTKQLHYAVCPDIDGKWLFAQINLEHPLRDDYQQSRVDLKKMVAGRFSISDIIIDGRCYGTIRFIVGSP